MKTLTNFPKLLTQFFNIRLIQQRNVSPHTISSYRDTFKLMLQFAKKQIEKEPSQLSIEDIDISLVMAFLDDLENSRGITPRSRNLRLAAIRSFFRYVSYELPEHSKQIQRILAIPAKRCNNKLIDYLNQLEVKALLEAPDRNSWSGRRDHAWMLLAVQTGLRVSELTGLTCQDVNLDSGAHVHVLGKGRKERCTPITNEMKTILKSWIKELIVSNEKILFPNQRGERLSTDGIQYLLNKHVKTASKVCDSLTDKRVSPHILRHTSAMSLLQAGVDITVIALWLGHESIETTHVYLKADLAMKEEILKKILPHNEKPVHYKPDDALLAFLKSL
jgi:site-specific recombinase XerD